jgi:hypothetical protein
LSQSDGSSCLGEEDVNRGGRRSASAPRHAGATSPHSMGKLRAASGPEPTRPTWAAPSDNGSRAARAALSAASLEAVLRLLDGDCERSGARYEAIRRKLVRFFECRGCCHADELADETMDRVGRRLAEGEHVRHADAGAYFHGVARNVLRELAAAPGAPAPARPAAVEGRRSARRAPVPVPRRLPGRCRRRSASSSSGTTSLASGSISGAAGPGQRALGIGMNALRIRAHRIRARLEACVRARLAAQIESVPSHAWARTPRTAPDDEARRRFLTALPERAECRCAQVPPMPEAHSAHRRPCRGCGCRAARWR